MKAAVAFTEDEFFDGFVVHSVGSFTPLTVSKSVHYACHDHRDGDRGNYVRVLTNFVQVRQVSEHKVQQEDEMVHGEYEIIDEPQYSEISLIIKI